MLSAILAICIAHTFNRNVLDQLKGIPVGLSTISVDINGFSSKEIHVAQNLQENSLCKFYDNPCFLFTAL